MNHTREQQEKYKKYKVMAVTDKYPGDGRMKNKWNLFGKLIIKGDGDMYIRVEGRLKNLLCNTCMPKDRNGVFQLFEWDEDENPNKSPESTGETPTQVAHTPSTASPASGDKEEDLPF